MKVSHLAPLVIGLATPFVGCGGDDGGSGEAGGSESSGSESGGTTTGTSTTMTVTSGVEGSGDSGGTQDGTESSSGGGGGEVDVSGVVHDYFGGVANPVAGAEVTVYGVDGVSATTDAMGAFTIGPVPADSEIAIVVAPSMDYMGSVYPFSTGDADTTDAEIPQISRATVQMQMDGIADQMPATPDLMQSIMIVGGQPGMLASPEVGASIDVMPAPPNDTYYAPDDQGAPVLGENTIAYNILPVVVYFNVAESVPGDIGVTADHATATCTVLHPEFPTVGEHVTFVVIECS